MSEGRHSVSIELLPEKKEAVPALLLGEKFDQQVKAYIVYLRAMGAPVNSAIIMGCAEGIVHNVDSNLFACNGRHILITKFWAQSLLSRMGFVKRRWSTKGKWPLVQNFDEIKAQFLLDIKAVVSFEEIPAQLVINLDQTGIHYIPVGSWTMDKEGSKPVEIIACDDKR